MKKYVVFKFPREVVGVYTDLSPACRDVGLDSRTVSGYINAEGYYMKQGVFIGSGPYYRSNRGFKKKVKQVRKIRDERRSKL